jgi:hypothetical protein
MFNPFDRGEDTDELTYGEIWDVTEEVSDFEPGDDGRDEPELPVG